jgi:hypothetical protein
MLITRDFKQLQHCHCSMQSANNCSSFQVFPACCVLTYMLPGSGFQQCGFSVLLPCSTASSWWLTTEWLGQSVGCVKWHWLLPAESFLVWDPTGFYCFLAHDWLVCLVNCCWPLPAQLLLISSPHMAYDGLGWSSHCLAKDISTIVAFRHYITIYFFSFYISMGFNIYKLRW